MNESELILKAQKGDKLAKEQMYLRYKLLIYKLVNKHKGFSTEQEDLKQIATIGLLNAIEKFDVTKNIKFMSYVYTAISNTIIAERKKESTVSIGQTVLKDIFAIKKAYANNPKLSVEELKEVTKLNKKKIDRAIETDRNTRTISIFKSITEEVKTNVGDMLKSDFSENDIVNKIIVKDLLKKLEGRNKFIILERFYACKSYAAIGRELNLTKERIRQIEQRILKNMRCYLKGQKPTYTFKSVNKNTRRM